MKIAIVVGRTICPQGKAAVMMGVEVAVVRVSAVSTRYSYSTNYTIIITVVVNLIINLSTNLDRGV